MNSIMKVLGKVIFLVK